MGQFRIKAGFHINERTPLPFCKYRNGIPQIRKWVEQNRKWDGLKRDFSRLFSTVAELVQQLAPVCSWMPVKMMNKSQLWASAQVDSECFPNWAYFSTSAEVRNQFAKISDAQNPQSSRIGRIQTLAATAHRTEG